MSTLKTQEKLYDPECPELFKHLLEILTGAMNTNRRNDPKRLKSWIEGASTYVMALIHVKEAGIISDFAARRFYKDIREIMVRVYKTSNRNRWTQGQKEFTFSIDLLRITFEPRQH